MITNSILIKLNDNPKSTLSYMISCINECVSAGEECITFRFDLNEDKLVYALKNSLSKYFPAFKIEVYSFWDEVMGEYNDSLKLYYMKITWKIDKKIQNKTLTN